MSVTSAPVRAGVDRTGRDPSIDDTIAAIATARGGAGLAVVRVSGPGAVEIADAVFRGRAPLAKAESHTLHHGWVVDDSGPVDEVVVGLFRAPRSYTREDVVELSCHGGWMPAQRVLDVLVQHGARRAGPGEFTLRAFLNGRIDLAQAEAVGDLIGAETEAARVLAVAQLAGVLSREVRAISEAVLDVLAEIEARVDFAEDVGGVEVPPHALEAMAACLARIDALRAGAAYARAIRQGVPAAIVGRPNVGKSSLFNALLGEERAIVTPIAGTTRDRVSDSLEIAGVRVTLTDTAGIRTTEEPVETIGVARSVESMETSALVVWVVDGSVAIADDDRQVAARLAGRRVVIAINKSDLGIRADLRRSIQEIAPPNVEAIVDVSAARRDGVDVLRGVIGSMLGASDGRDAGVARASALGAVVANPRHGDAVDRAAAALRRGHDSGRGGQPGEIVAIELREARSALGEITGETVDADLLDRIFGRFCIGK